MAERYSRLFTLSEELYSAGSPLMIAAGALLKDNQTGKVLAQLKLKSISSKVIKAVKVKLQPQDTVNRPLGAEVSYEYLDLSIERDGEFGAKNAIQFPDASARAFAAEITEVSFADNSVWTSAGEAWKPLPAAETFEDKELEKQYQIHFGEKAKFKFLKLEGIWRCSCGGINSDEEPSCHLCGNQLLELVACDQKKLVEEKEQRLAKEKEEQEAKAVADKEKTRKRMKIAVPVAAAIILCIVLVPLFTKVILPNSRYNKAFALAESGQYEEAVAAFEALGDYKDSKEQLKVAKEDAKYAASYNDAVALAADGQYEEAITAFKAISGYKDSKDQIKLLQENIKERDYNNAVMLLESGNIIEAYEIFAAMDGYKDSAQRASNLYVQFELEKLKTASVGDVVLFGSYEQDNVIENGKEPIEWIVLDVQDGKLLVISRYALDCQKYNIDNSDVTWETCSLRKWLNSTFVKDAFSAEEQEKIPTATISADKNPNYKTNPGNSTEDQVFLLSVLEVKKYFASDTKWLCKPTAYAVAQGCYVNKDNGNCIWWLRSPGYRSYCAVCVRDDSVGDDSYEFNRYNNTVRPAMWINLGS